MQRREVLRLLGAVAVPALALSPDRLHALGGSVARRVARGGAVGFFSPDQFRTVDQLAELILPRTDTPGARDAGVARFIEVIVGEWDADADRSAFLDGLTAVDARSAAVGARPFVDLATEQQHAVLAALEAESRTAAPMPTPFFTRLKALTLYGYYTSEVGIRDELQEVFMPGRFDGEAPLPARARPS